MTGEYQQRRPISSGRPISARPPTYSSLPRGPSIDEDHELVIEDLDTDSLSGFDFIAEPGSNSLSRSSRPTSARQSRSAAAAHRGINPHNFNNDEDRVVIEPGTNAARKNAGPVRPLSARPSSANNTYAALDRGNKQTAAGLPSQVYGSTAASAGQRFTRYYFPLSGTGPEEASKNAATVRPSARRPSSARPASAPVKRSTYYGRPASAAMDTRLKGPVESRLPFYGHYDVVTTWDMDDPVLDAAAWSPNLGFQRMQMAYIPLKNHTPSAMGASMYQRPQSARKGAEGTTLKRLPSDLPPKEDDMLWLKYSTREVGEAFDLQELAAWAVQLRPRSVQDTKPCFILLQGLLKDILQDKLRGYSGEMQEILSLFSKTSIGARSDLEDMQREVESALHLIPDTNAQAKVKAAMLAATEKLENALCKVGRYGDQNKVESIIEARRAMEDSWKREQKLLEGEIASLTKMLYNAERENSELKARMQVADTSAQDPAQNIAAHLVAVRQSGAETNPVPQALSGWTKERHWDGLQSLALNRSGDCGWAVCRCGAVLYAENGLSENLWRQVTSCGITLSQIAVSGNGKHVWGLDCDGTLHFRQGPHGDWKTITGQQVAHISVSAEGDHVWGISKQGSALYRWGPSRPWQKVDGISSLRQIVVSGDGKHLWAVNAKDQVFYRSCAGAVGTWRMVEGSMCQVTVSHDGMSVWGVNSNSVLFRRSGPEDVCWTKLDGDVDSVIISGNGRIVLGYNKAAASLFRRSAAD